MNRVKLMFWGSLLTIAMMVTHQSSATSHGGGKKDAETTTKEMKAAQMRFEKITKESLALMAKNKREALPVLTLDQVVKLDHWNRVRYIYQLRQAMVDLEAIQKRFGMELVALNSQERNELYALIFGDFANAQQGIEEQKLPKLHDRGFMAGDECIYGMHLQKYYSGQGFYGCEKPNDSEHGCTHPTDGRGFRCGFVGSGLTGDDACFAYSQRLGSSEWCREQSERLTNDAQRGALAAKAVENYEAFLKTKDGKVSNFSTEEIKTWSDELTKHTFNPSAFAHLLKLAHANRQKGYPVKDNRYLIDVAKNFDRTGALLDRAFSGHLEHCDKQLTDKAIAGIKANGSKPGAEKRSSWYHQDYQRMKLIESLGDDKTKYTVGNVLQKSECSDVKRRYTAVKEKMDDINKTFPDEVERPETKIAGYDPKTQEPIKLAPGSRPGPNPRRGKVVPGTEVAAPAPATPNPVNPEAKTVGEPFCGDPATGNDSYADTAIHEASFRCLVCAAERDVLTNDDRGAGENRKGAYAEHGVSKKWLALMAIMSKKCGDHAKAGDSAEMQTALNYLQTFGHCDAGTYEWDKKEWKDDDEAKIRAWQLGKSLDTADKGGKWYEAGDFKRLFGENLDKMEDIFCNKDSANRFAQSDNRHWAQRRLSSLTNAGRWNGETKGFSACFHEAYANAEHLYHDGRVCRGLVDANSPKAKLRNAPDGSIPPHIAQISPGQCFVSHSIQKRGNSPETFVSFKSSKNGAPAVSYSMSSEKFIPAGKSDNWQVKKVTALGREFCPVMKDRKHNYIPDSKTAK